MQDLPTHPPLGGGQWGEGDQLWGGHQELVTPKMEFPMFCSKARTPRWPEGKGTTPPQAELPRQRQREAGGRD